MTHDLIANMLGVRREGVSIAAGRLQNAGLIKYVRGTITMLDRKALERAACECYQVVKDEYDRPPRQIYPAESLTSNNSQSGPVVRMCGYARTRSARTSHHVL
jgi:hypothetical protein